MANTPAAGLYTSNHGSLTDTRSIVLYSGRGRALHQSGIGFCASSGDASAKRTNRILRTHHLRHARGGWSVAAALNADSTIGDDHADAGQVSFLNTVQ